MIQIESLVSQKYPVDTVLVPKSGSLFLRKLFYAMDHGVIVRRKEEALLNTGLTYSKPKNIFTSLNRHKFIFYRHPIDRFLAFYFGQILNEKDIEFEYMRDQLRNRNLITNEIDNRETHQRNLIIFLDYLKEGPIQSAGLLNLPDHLAPQYKWLLPALDIGFSPIDLFRANFELVDFIEEDVPNIKKLINQVSRSTRAFTNYQANTLVNTSIEERFKSIYEADLELYWSYRNWQV